MEGRHLLERAARVPAMLLCFISSFEVDIVKLILLVVSRLIFIYVFLQAELETLSTHCQKCAP